LDREGFSNTIVCDVKNDKPFGFIDGECIQCPICCDECHLEKVNSINQMFCDVKNEKPFDFIDGECIEIGVLPIQDHSPSERYKLFSNPLTNVTRNGLVLGSATSVTINTLISGGCPRVGIALIKAFQLIEILGVSLFMPIVWQDWLLDAFYGIYDLR
jgi:hypothetical protein